MSTTTLYKAGSRRLYRALLAYQLIFEAWLLLKHLTYTPDLFMGWCIFETMSRLFSSKGSALFPLIFCLFPYIDYWRQFYVYALGVITSFWTNIIFKFDWLWPWDLSSLRWRPRLAQFTEVKQRRPRLVLEWVTSGKTEHCEPVSVRRCGS